MNAVKPNFKLKEILSIIKSGIVGALALSGICVILFAIGYAVRNQFISRLYAETFAKCSFEGLFITTSGLGFILGIIARRRLTLKYELALIAALSVPIIVGAWLLHAATTHFSLPHSIKLIDCTNSVVDIHLKAPKGH